MSHFTAMVFGDDVDGQLAPFHEFECTGQNDQYVQDIDETEEYRQRYDNYLKETGGNMPALSMREFLIEKEYVGNETILTAHQKPDLDGDHKYGYYVLDQGELVKAVRRTNPNAKWDWYQIGGRWQGMLKLKPEYAEAVGHLAALKARGKTIPESLVEKCAGIAQGEPSLLMQDHKFDRFHVDQAPKGKIDFDGMVNDHLSQVMPTFDKAIAAINGRTWKTWQEVRESDEFKGDIDAARKYFNGQPAVKDMQGALEGRFFIDWEDFKKPREQYVAEQSMNALSTFAMIKDGQWQEQGSMGWFGMSIDKEEKSAWYARMVQMLTELPDDTLITIVDCHI